ncbi:hypothetical protein JCM18918_3333 [Cutibacterium acnes JCM 18918]|nr:hypothetical protein JCM18918_3333 [Cutibacterium acnes JCM 18918]
MMSVGGLAKAVVVVPMAIIIVARRVVSNQFFSSWIFSDASAVVGYRAGRGRDAGLTTTCGALDMKAPQTGWGGIR